MNSRPVRSARRWSGKSYAFSSPAATFRSLISFSRGNASRFCTHAELVTRGADLAKICDEVYQSYPLSRARLLKHVYTTFRLTHDNQIAYFWLKKKDFTRTGAEADDSEGLIDHIRAIAPVEVACLFEELQPELTRISLRSKNDEVNVNEIAAEFGGGGHKAAAGARIPGNPAAAQRKVITAAKKALEAAKKK